MSVNEITRKILRDDTASIIIGLGGTGVSAISRIKKEIASKFDTSEDKLNTVKFIAIDSDASAIQLISEADAGKIDPDSEFLDISIPDYCKVMENIDSLHPHYKDWINPELSCEGITFGTGGVRQLGRLAFMEKAEQFTNLLSNKLVSALKAAKGFGTNVNIYIVSGLAGGTGSGAVLDVCYLVHNMCAELGLCSACIAGIFVCPEVYFSIPGINNSPVASNQIKANGFAALSELDYCMNFSTNKGSFEQNYGHVSVNTNQTPVDICYLVSCVAENGIMLQDGYSYVLDTVAGFVCGCLEQNQNSDNNMRGLVKYAVEANRSRAGLNPEYAAVSKFNFLGFSELEYTDELTQESVEKLWYESQPLFFRAYSYRESYGTACEIRIPADDDKALENVTPIAESKHADVSYSKGNGTVSMLRSYYGIPLSAINFAVEGEKRYKQESGKSGCFLYESEKTDWRKIPS